MQLSVRTDLRFSTHAARTARYSRHADASEWSRKSLQYAFEEYIWEAIQAQVGIDHDLSKQLMARASLLFDSHAASSSSTETMQTLLSRRDT